MKIFGLNFGSSSNHFKITEDDRTWLEENFRWLKSAFGYPNKRQEQVLLTPKFFPATFSVPTVGVDNIVTDLCKLFGLARNAVAFEIVTDIRDFDIPYQMEGAPFECEAVLTKGQYKISIANDLQKRPQRLLHRLIYEFIRIRLTESKIEFDTDEDAGPFVYLVGIYFGFGVILAQNLSNVGRSSQGGWQSKWGYVSEITEPVMAFGLAIYANLLGDNDPSWKNELKGDFKKLFEGAIAYLQAKPNDVYDEKEVKANDLFNEACKYSESNQFEAAISTLQKILFLTTDDLLKTDVYNNIGYYYARLRDYPQAISNYKKALVINPDHAYANDNLGFALIMTGEPDEGVLCLEKAMQNEQNDPAYTYRNFALYHQHKKESHLAEQFFQRSFSEGTPVDLLEYHYAEFLLAQGDIENAKTFFLKSAQKNEEEGVARLRQFDRSDQLE